MSAREQQLETALRQLVAAVDESECFDDDQRIDRAVKNAAVLLRAAPVVEPVTRRVRS